MLKKIPPSDISIRPFKAYKEWSFIYSGSSNQLNYLKADFTNPNVKSDSTIATKQNLSFDQQSLYGQLRAQFYNGKEDNPFIRSGHKSNVYNADVDFINERYFTTEAKVISIPQKYIGEGIKKNSVLLDDTINNLSFSYDGYGNLVINGATQVTNVNIDFETGVFTFTYTYPGPNPVNYVTSVSNKTWNMNTGDVIITYEGNDYPCKLISLDTNTVIATFDQLAFLTGTAASGYVGNVFYNQGLIVITRYLNIILENGINDNPGFKLNFKSTETIYENEYLLVVGEDEFNISTNPSAVVSIGQQIEKFTDSDGKVFTVIPYPGAKYVRKQTILDDGTLLDYGYTGSVSPLTKRVGFEQIEVSSSIDPTGSFLAPFITTIGLYDDDANCVAVAKLPQPIKCLPDIPLNFIVRFDT